MLLPHIYIIGSVLFKSHIHTWSKIQTRIPNRNFPNTTDLVRYFWLLCSWRRIALKQYSSALSCIGSIAPRHKALYSLTVEEKPPRVRLDRGFGSYTSNFKSVCLADIFGVELIELRGSDGEWGKGGKWAGGSRSSEGACVSRERRLALLQRDADHRLRGCCGIKGFVSQSPLTLSSQCRLQVLRQPWTRNNSWPQRLTLECPPPPPPKPLTRLELDSVSGGHGSGSCPYQPPGTIGEWLAALAPAPLPYYLF